MAEYVGKKGIWSCRDYYIPCQEIMEREKEMTHSRWFKNASVEDQSHNDKLDWRSTLSTGYIISDYLNKKENLDVPANRYSCSNSDCYSAALSAE